jgi:tetratricopeptide (TPR) repeat protein
VEAARWDPPRIIALLDKALAADPKFAPARVKKAFIHLIMVDGGYSADPSWLDRAEEQLTQVQAVSPGYHRTHSALAAVSYYRRRCDQTAQHAKVALNADPKDLESRIWMVNCALIGGGFQQARALLEEILSAAPTSFPARMNLASLLRYQGDTTRSAAESRRILEQDPDLVYSKRELAAALLDEGDLSGARGVLESVLPERQGNYHIVWTRALLLAREGRQAEALALMTQDALAWAAIVPHCAEWPAEVLASVGMPAEAVKWLKAAVAKDDRRRSWFARDPHLASLRARPDFQALLASMRSEKVPVTGEHRF